MSTVNIAGTPSDGEPNDLTYIALSRPLARVIHRLDALILVLKTCKGRQCTTPWETLFPNGHVNSLLEALDMKFDNHFEHHLARVSFDRCEKGYISESEGPMWDSSQSYTMDEEVAYT